ncbi:MAG: hypothetical protein K9G38_05295, partial [Bacteroidales bacterium]|nr:hypothetical protein [Bacteroidales bacterium]
MSQLKILIRRLVKDRLLTFINIFGLVAGISSFLVLFVHVNNERLYDKHLQNSENIYRVLSTPAHIDQNS